MCHIFSAFNKIISNYIWFFLVYYYMKETLNNALFQSVIMYESVIRY